MNWRTWTIICLSCAIVATNMECFQGLPESFSTASCNDFVNGLVLLLIGGVISVLWYGTRYFLRKQRRKKFSRNTKPGKQMSSLALWMLTGATLGAIAWYAFNAWSPSPRNEKDYEWSGPIRWDFSKPNAPLWISGNRSPGDDAYVLKVRAFNAFGRNTSKDPIMKVNGRVISDSTAEQFPIVFLVQVREGSPYRSPDQIVGIPADADFHIQAHFTDESQANPGIDVEDFLALHPNLTFVFEYDGKKFTRKFALPILEDQINEMRRIVRKNTENNSGVRPRP